MDKIMTVITKMPAPNNNPTGLVEILQGSSDIKIKKVWIRLIQNMVRRLKGIDSEIEKEIKEALLQIFNI